MLHFAKWKIILVLAVSVLGLLLAMPNIMSESTRNSIPDWLPHNAMHLGLDLQGGAHVVLQVKERLCARTWTESASSTRSCAAPAMK